ncbi:MAG: hypothetical protein B7X31_05230 [Thiomonas sp. 13-66-29]|nr:ParB-like protein [Thiomonas sp.]OZB63808.1 MAG: hypothetical protein B7X31_05230 [Thiomonas sp. 13-66-29]
MPIYRHHLIEVELKALRPTQMTVGMGEVRQKSEHWSTLDPLQRSHYLSRHWFPAVRGPKARYYIIDHHHLGLALILEKVQSTQLVLMQDFAALSPREFWVVMDQHQWVHPYDRHGHRRDFNELPKKLTDLIDDPYRSLAGVIKSSGGFPKDGEPFAEFLWADFFRRRISAQMLKTDPEGAVGRAQELAHGKESSHLPGWSGINFDGEDDLDTDSKTSPVRRSRKS